MDSKSNYSMLQHFSLSLFSLRCGNHTLGEDDAEKNVALAATRYIPNGTPSTVFRFVASAGCGHARFDAGGVMSASVLSLPPVSDLKRKL